jgi:minor extracellular serine protease Vpr
MVFARTPMRFAAAALTGLLLASACTKSDDKSDPTAITNRPQSYDRFIAILKLQNPALLSTATRNADGSIVVDEALKQAIADEQAAVTAELTALSPDVRVIHTYKMVLNGLAVLAPKALESHFRQLTSVSYVEREERFERLAPVTQEDSPAASTPAMDVLNSVTHIGGDRAHALGIKGSNTTVGVIDTGIDYTHAMFGGAGTEQSFLDNNPDTIETGSFPTAKVVGGIDLVGTDYNTASPNFDQHVPIPDADPIDEAGHGTHVAGSVAGIGDNTNTYSGVAPEAALHSIKVFGKDGSTGDGVIIASLEYAADPTGSLDPNKQLDVVNLSLGSGFGTPHILYGEAVKNLVKGGTVVVASAGNSGHNAYIVGAPGTADDAISVAASIDGMEHNWKFAAVKFSSASNPALLSEAIEAAVTKPIADVEAAEGKLVFLGTAATDLTDEQKAAVRGNVALIDRGQVPFADKIRRAAEAGAIGVIVANNVVGDAFVMGGDGSYEIPGIMITKALADILKADMATGEARVNFKTPERIEKPQLIDTLTGFSSRGPRSVDGALKPEIAAPGSNIISAKMGGGAAGVRMSGTSMSAPHMAGVMALMKQTRPNADVLTLKSLVMTTATSIDDANGQVYPVAHMGAGRVRADAAIAAKLAVVPAAVALGEVLVEQAKTVKKTLTLTNLSDAAVTATLTSSVDAGLTVTAPASVELAAGESKTITVKVKVTAAATDDASKELDGFLKVTVGETVHQVPVLAVVNRTSRAEAKNLVVNATSPADAPGAAAELTLVNAGTTSADALVFNLLGKDGRKEAALQNVARNAICDLESVGYRLVEQDGVKLLQFAAKLYNPVTSWHICELSIQIDGNGDGVADQELLGTYLQNLTDNAAQVNTFASVLTDGNKMREIRRAFEQSFPDATSAVYTEAILDMQDYKAYGHSTVAVVSADVSKLAKQSNGKLKVKIAVLADSSTPESDDYLGDAEKWTTIVASDAGMAFVGMPESVTLAAGETKVVELTKGGKNGNAVVYMPFNQSTASLDATDKQQKVLKPTFSVD